MSQKCKTINGIISNFGLNILKKYKNKETAIIIKDKLLLLGKNQHTQIIKAEDYISDEYFKEILKQMKFIKNCKMKNINVKSNYSIYRNFYTPCKNKITMIILLILNSCY